MAPFRGGAPPQRLTIGAVQKSRTTSRFRFAGVFEPQALPSGGLKNGLQAAKGYKPSRDDQRLRLLLAIQAQGIAVQGEGEG
jgi:hypothetical protein